jgi:hypothetical protein
MVGARIAAAVVSQRGSRDEFAYDRNVDRWMDRMLAYAGAVPVPAASEAMRAVDGSWWDSTKRIPDMSLVKKRYFDTGPKLTPWLVPPAKFGPLLKAACPGDPKPLPIDSPSSMSGIDFATEASLVIDLPDSLAKQEPFVKLGRRITQKDFPVILDYIRAQNRELFGPGADGPGIDPPPAAAAPEAGRP